MQRAVIIAVIIVSVILVELKILHYSPDDTYMRQIARHDPGQAEGSAGLALFVEDQAGDESGATKGKLLPFCLEKSWLG